MDDVDAIRADFENRLSALIKITSIDVEQHDSDFACALGAAQTIATQALVHAPEAIKAMRDWIADCSWPDLPPDEVADLTEAQVIAGVAKHYDGGVDAFMRTMENGTTMAQIIAAKFIESSYEAMRL